MEKEIGIIFNAGKYGFVEVIEKDGCIGCVFNKNMECSEDKKEIAGECIGKLRSDKKPVMFRSITATTKTKLDLGYIRVPPIMDKRTILLKKKRMLRPASS